MQYAEEPQIPNRVTLETKAGDGWQPHPAMIANLTRHEVWIRIGESLGESVLPERPVRLVLSHADGVRTAETSVLWHIGLDGMLVVLLRPTIWDPPSRRAHSRARLSIPATLAPGGDSPELSARTTNVGVGGFFCVADGPVAAGVQLPVSLKLTPMESFDCRAEVVRCEADPDDEAGKRALLAFRFLDLPTEDQGRLANSLVSLTDDVDDDSVPLPWRGGGLAN